MLKWICPVSIIVLMNYQNYISLNNLLTHYSALKFIKAQQTYVATISFKADWKSTSISHNKGQ